jgi:putative (di)nucleoside polyphosphate hydrolase
LFTTSAVVADFPKDSMNDVIDPDGFRANVGIVLMRGGGEVFLGRRVGGRGWQFPQGGVRDGEDFEEAVLRELNEEVGLKSTHVEIAGSTVEWLRYRLPPRYVRRNRSPLCIGQKQRWYLLRLRGDEVAFDFGLTAEPEFDAWRWVDYWEPVREVIYFKRPVYAQALTELADRAFPEGPPPLPSWWDEVTRQDAETPAQTQASAG